MPESAAPSAPVTPLAPGRHELMLVAIGASAGGLGALKEVFSSLPTGRALSYVVAQHLSPSHKSMLAELLVGNTRLRVVNIEDDVTPAVETVYITPPGHDLVMEDGKLRLVDPSATVGPTPRVDRLFRSLAQHWGEDLIGIILSGTGSDGAAGMRAIKEAGGITIIQDPSTTEYDGMPRAAAQASQIDLTLAAGDMGRALQSIIDSPTHALPVKDSDTGADRYREVVELLRRHSGIDLAQYKSGTVQRRLQRRMALRRKSTLAEYTDLLRGDHDEIRQLATDILISVTSFYRDGKVWEGLRKVLDQLVENASERDLIRIWVSACATGEEAYTVAMLMQEACRERPGAPDFLIFATDLDANAVEHARYGLYPTAAIGELPEQLANRYLVSEGKRFRVSKQLRQRMIFATQDLLRDPPFSNMHLITCRNLMIYLTPAAQRQVLSTFHYALRSGGMLMLGRSESVEGTSRLFEVAESNYRIYRRCNRDAGSQGLVTALPAAIPQGGEKQSFRRAAPVDLSEVVRQRLLSQYGPPSLVLDSNDNIIQLSGDLSGLLKFPDGSAQWQLYTLLDSAFSGEVRALLHRCRDQREEVSGARLRRTINNEEVGLRIMARPLDIQGQMELILLCFEIGEVTENIAKLAPEERESSLVTELEKELASTREHLQTVIQEVETSNEELQALNEEMQSANEELQSTNEELQTSNEELQSTNEELVTVNDELVAKSRELETLTGQLQNVRDGLDFPLLVLDPEMHMQQHNAAADRLLELDELEPDTPLHLAPWRYDMQEAIGLAHQVARSGKPEESTLTIGTLPRRFYRLRAMPYRESGHEGCGVILSFIDHSREYRAREALAEREARYRALFDRNGIGMALVDQHGQFREYNPALARVLAYDPGQLKKLSLGSLLHEETAGPSFVTDEAAERDAAPSEWEGALRRGDGQWRWMVLVSCPVVTNDARPDTREYIVHFLDASSAHHWQEHGELLGKRLKLLGETAAALHAGTAREALFAHSVEKLEPLLPQTHVGIGYLDAEGRRHASTGTPFWQETGSDASIGLADCKAYRDRLGKGRPVIIDNLRQTSQHQSLRDALREGSVQSMLEQPIGSADADGRIWCLGLHAGAPREWSDVDLATVRSMAQLLALARD